MHVDAILDCAVCGTRDALRNLFPCDVCCKEVCKKCVKGTFSRATTGRPIYICVACHNEDSATRLAKLTDIERKH